MASSCVPNSSKVIFDFDGVICKNNKLNKEVNRRSIEFVVKKTRLSYNEAKYFNNANYKEFGHTVSMLKSYGVHTNLKEYNDYVFNDAMWYNVNKILTDTDKKNIYSVKYFNTLIDDKSILFSNAPFNWCNNILSICNIDTNDIFEDIYTCDTNEEHLKPKPKLYDKIESKYKEFDLYFLDDNKHNLECAPSRWQTVHISRNDNIGENLLRIASEINAKQDQCFLNI